MFSDRLMISVQELLKKAAEIDREMYRLHELVGRPTSHELIELT
jgi:predicted ATP-grasp superfamily ATP-dependent carboligase